MHREEAHELVHALVHAAVEPGEGRQVLPDSRLLLHGLLEQALGHHELHVWRAMRICSKRSLTRRMLSATKEKRGLSKMASCTPAMKRKRRSLQTSPTLAEKVQVENQLLVLAGAQVIEQFIDHQEQAVIRDTPRGRRHHLFEGALVIRYLLHAWKGIMHAEQVRCCSSSVTTISRSDTAVPPISVRMTLNLPAMENALRQPGGW